MKENKYDDKEFFDRYAGMDRSVKGLAGAGEWRQLRAMLPDMRGKRVLDLGCGFGWHCIHAAQQGAAGVTGIDISERMIAGARSRNAHPNIVYRQCAVEDYACPGESFDVVLSSLAFHYLESFDAVCRMVHSALVPGGEFVFSVEHPVFTAEGSQEWFRDAAGKALHWPVDSYFTEGRRDAVFLGQRVVKYHRTLTTYLGGLLRAGFRITDICEPQPSEELLRSVPGMADELRRPMMLLVAARKEADADAERAK